VRDKPGRLALALLGAWLAGQLVVGQPAAANYEVYAVRFADVPYSVGSLVAGADRARMIDIAFTVWAMKGGGHTVLLDAGFYRDKFMDRWKPQHYARPSDALKTGLGLGPEQITDIVISHSHWDHADGVDLFPNATIWIQREEYEYYVGSGGEVLHAGGVDAEDARMLASLKAAGRVKLVDGDAREILPGLTVYTGGKHTFASQYVGVQTRSGIVVLASDNAYLYENLERHLAIAQTLDAEANLAAQARMLKMAAAPRFVIPGHDPAVFQRFPQPGSGVARID
jgi:glyoxylase-like metal-dependent hydrolase (beta-lactamase superfamily II)